MYNFNSLMCSVEIFCSEQKLGLRVFVVVRARFVRFVLAKLAPFH